MRFIVGLINKKEKNVMHALLRMFPKDLKNHEKIIFIGNNYLPNTNLAEVGVSALDGHSKGKGNSHGNDHGHIGIAYCYLKKKNNKVFPFTKYEDNINDFNILYGDVWKQDVQSLPDNKTTKLNGNYFLVTKKGSDFFISKDKIGVKQIYYGENSDHVGFSSRKKFLSMLGLDVNRLLPGEMIKLGGTGIERLAHKSIKKPEITIFDERVAIKIYKKSLINSVKKRVENVDNVGIIFSGGIDSTLIGKIVEKTGKKVKCYCAGISGSEDINAVKESAEDLGLPIKIINLNDKKIKNLLPRIITTIESWDQLQVESAIPVYCAMERAAKDGMDVVLNGQGADELFAGYDWYPMILEVEGAKELTDHMWEDLKLSYRDIFERENKIAEFHNIELHAPYCDVDLIKTAMKISINLKTQKDDAMRKYIHRRMGEELKIPLSNIWREKEPAHQTSGVHEVLKAVAEKNGYNDNNNYELKTSIEKLGSIYRDGNRYRPEDEKFGDRFIQAFLEELALDLGVAK